MSKGGAADKSLYLCFVFSSLFYVLVLAHCHSKLFNVTTMMMAKLTMLITMLKTMLTLTTRLMTMLTTMMKTQFVCLYEI